MKNFVFFILIALLMSGCFQTVEVKVLTKTSYVPLSVNEAYLADCELVQPPLPSDVVKMSTDERDYAYTTAMATQFGYTKACTKEKRSIRKQLQENISLIEEMNQNEETRVANEKAKLER